MHFLYNLSVHFYTLSIRIASMFTPKAKLWIKGRKDIFQNLENTVKNEKDIVWFHCASLGEFEQGRPIIEGYIKKYPAHKILLTFFSPSGFEIQKKYAGVDWVFYLPADTPKNAKQFVEIVSPLKAIFVKYEFWLNHMAELKKQEIPFYSVSSIFRKEQPFFRYKNNWFAKQLKNASHFFVQDNNSKELLNSIGISSVTISGDTRFDCVKSNVQNVKQFPLIEVFSKSKPTIVCGSTWPRDEMLLTQYIKENSQYNYIIAPHELTNVPELQKGINALLFSEANQHNIYDVNVLIIDSIGLLSSIYKYGTIAYVGGGFGRGIHNILEAIAFGLPVIFGPNYQKSKEAKELIDLTAAKNIKNYQQLKEALEGFTDFDNAISAKYISDNSGATDLIISNI
ncbi:MAG: glycosyltransferase N-terminal domain-containing protein [Bacteroidota bacterium]|nr:glycosyltransferase N-terminal domain-containing protein [Bacteroidota bacterium]